MKTSFLLVLVLTLMSFTVNAGIYKWVDKDGNVHFGDNADHRDAEELNIDGGADKKSNNENTGDEELTRDEKRQRLLDVMNEDREERNSLKEEERRKQKNKKIRCAQLKDKLRTSKSATGLYNLDKDGKRVFLSHKDRSKAESSLRKRIDKHCR